MMWTSRSQWQEVVFAVPASGPSPTGSRAGPLQAPVEGQVCLQVRALLSQRQLPQASPPPCPDIDFHGLRGREGGLHPWELARAQTSGPWAKGAGPGPLVLPPAGSVALPRTAPLPSRLGGQVEEKAKGPKYQGSLGAVTRLWVTPRGFARCSLQSLNVRV